jgi:hypothetical protein
VLAIYVQVAILFGVYTPELFPTEVRLRVNGICNTLGRAACIVSPFIALSLATNYGMPGVLGLMIALVVVQIVVVWAWGVETRQRSGVRAGSAGVPPALPCLLRTQKEERAGRPRSAERHFFTYFITRLGPTSAP